MNPYLSFVVAARNDNYGGDFLGRMQMFVRVLLQTSDKYGLDYELVIVEWNPPEGRAYLRDAICWPKGSLASRVRIVEVPKEIHRQLPNSEKMPMFEYIAKNVGIRRASGEYVLATNPDILFSERLIRHLAAKPLAPDTFYRANRYDILNKIPTRRSVRKQLLFCAAHAFRKHQAEGSVALDRSARLRNYLSEAYPWASGFRRTARSSSAETSRPSEEEIARHPDWIPEFFGVHVFAPGDFMLMSAKRWHSLRAYPEFATHSHIDSYLVYLAALAGLKQVIFPFPIYHQEHDRSEQSLRPMTVLGRIPAFQQMFETRRPEITNTENWGLGHVGLHAA